MADIWTFRHTYCRIWRIMLACAVFFAAWSPSFASEKAGPQYLYPNPAITPGAINPDVTQETINETICSPRWSTKSIRPSSAYTTKLKRRQIRQYGYTDTDLSHYKEDHFISLELGGHPYDPNNLWPEPYETSVNGVTIGAHQKDRVEDYLHAQVCAGRLTLTEAQQAIREDWYKIYVTLSKHTASWQGVNDDNDRITRYVESQL